MSISFVRWQPWQEMETVRRQLDQLFEEMVPTSVFDSARDSLSTTVNRAVRVPAIELLTTEKTLILRAELPGLESKDLDIQVTRETVSIQGNKQSAFGAVPEAIAKSPADAEPEATATDEPVAQIYRSEFRYGAFHRVIELPVEVDPDQVVADFTQGILTLTMPKLNNDRRRAVKVALEG